MKLRVVLPLLLLASLVPAPAEPSTGAESWLKIKAAAEKGDAEAQLALGILYSDPEGKTFDPVEAEVWLEQAAKQGNLQAIARLGVMLSRGTGRNRATPREPDSSPGQQVVTKKEAVENGVGESVPVSDLSPRASDESRKMNEDPETTVRWSLLLSGLRGADAYVVRGYLLENGVGMMRDYEAAADVYRRAAGLGSALAQFRLGQLYAEGRGVPRDLAKACFWLRLAVAAGSREAGPALAVLLPCLDKEQLAAADRMAREGATLVERNNVRSREN